MSKKHFFSHSLAHLLSCKFHTDKSAMTCFARVEILAVQGQNIPSYTCPLILLCSTLCAAWFSLFRSDEPSSLDLFPVHSCCCRNSCRNCCRNLTGNCIYIENTLVSIFNKFWSISYMWQGRNFSADGLMMSCCVMDFSKKLLCSNITQLYPHNAGVSQRFTDGKAKSIKG